MKLCNLGTVTSALQQIYGHVFDVNKARIVKSVEDTLFQIKGLTISCFFIAIFIEICYNMI